MALIRLLLAGVSAIIGVAFLWMVISIIAIIIPVIFYGMIFLVIFLIMFAALAEK
ncbi:hypothetical protein Ab1vBOLIVR2_gp82 [Agrobacterium phage OLIVR2]|uniref:Uncharacterized protein n=1 Tax=Agrobacterium phage OLIVR1 TaxID=2723769 RepID=A0A858MRU9_9CAUD|nr:hypothetical protein KNU98_gp026 [Agrobacterium phage OLIVR1]QIW87278.1 hypothetical protein Ab1vBOLIVR1_gp83 [Agrobacterium phage OLIVR1]QIW87385.1 hypothetical protein Ab1vBOLIVR2_gp82 [Agrobacterium phage OLIVR2]QIW87492.1 hypothetical protein Ab1vBOLIVR3_gp82 [Agrobacterium phage OLIVR3]